MPRLFSLRPVLITLAVVTLLAPAMRLPVEAKGVPSASCPDPMRACPQAKRSSPSVFPGKCIAQCPDGYKYPTCTEEGYPINYFLDPCRAHRTTPGGVIRQASQPMSPLQPVIFRGTSAALEAGGTGRSEK